MSSVQKQVDSLSYWLHDIWSEVEKIPSLTFLSKDVVRWCSRFYIDPSGIPQEIQGRTQFITDEFFLTKTKWSKFNGMVKKHKLQYVLTQRKKTT